MRRERQDMRGARGRGAAAIDPAAALRRAGLWLAAAAAGAIALGACKESGPEAERGSRPARLGDASLTRNGDVEPGGPGPGVTMPPTATSPTPRGMAGSGPAAPASDPSGSIWRPGNGRMKDGDPNDPLVRGILAQMDQTELALARLGQEKGRDPAVRQYATAMVQAHERSLAQAGAPPAGDAASVVTPLTEWHERAVLRLQTVAPGPDFDHAFMALQTAKHEGALQMLTQLEHSTRADPLVAQIRQRERDVEHHIEQARAIQLAVSRPPAGTSDPGLSAPANGFFVRSTTQTMPPVPGGVRPGGSTPTRDAGADPASPAASTPASSVPAQRTPPSP